MGDDAVDPRLPYGLVGSDDSPWARAVPIQPAPILPASWSESLAPPSPPLIPPVSTEMASPVGGPVTTTAAAAPDVVERRRRWPVLAGVGAALVALVVVAAQVAGGHAPSSEADVSTPPATAPATANTSPMTTPSSSGPERSAATTASSISPPPAEWTAGSINLAPRLAAMTVPTQVVIRRYEGSDELLTLVDIPSGTTHSIPDREPINSASMVVGDSAIVILPVRTQLALVYRVGSEPVGFAIPKSDLAVRARWGTDTFVVVNFDGPNLKTSVLTADGAVTAVTDGPLTSYDAWSGKFYPTTGELMVTDAGGTYALDDAGHARRVSAGDLEVVGPNHIVVRKCDEQRTCGYELVDARNGETVPSDFGQLVVDKVDQGSSLSPDGSKLVTVDPSDPERPLSVTDLRTGALSQVGGDQLHQSADTTQSPNSIWAADSSGLFVVQAGQLVFFDATTGEYTPVTTDTALNNVIDVAARPTPP